ncbi:MAG: DNA-binding transcriptional regulator [Gammaproteobacteria bacterium]|nr:DNA-binding transcriptional regulator [Gammaproteobacteria bacterium]|tara:strand:+ start:518 stop:823 length:306 start_codon:yes stop_codon:yes gene_type:complete
MKPNRKESIRQQEYAEEALFKALAALTETNEVKIFFKDLCTPAELQALTDRWQVVKYLQKKLPYRTIHELTGVSVTTIGRVARSLTTGAGGYQAAIDRISH